MQAQAAGGGGEGAQGLLQNPKVQIGVIAGGAIALIVVIFLLFFNNGASPAPTPNPGGPAADATPPAVVSPGSAEPGASEGSGAAPAALAPAAPALGATPGGGPAPTGGAAPTEATAAPAGPGVPIRKNPFAQNKELQKVLDSIPDPPPPPDVAAQAHNIYVEELYKPKPVTQVGDQEENEGPPIPTMRVAGVVYGRQVSATLQIGQQYMQVTPGQMIPASNPVYRVESIEQDTVHLSRRWEMGSRKGVQRIEVGLSARAATPGGGAFNGGGAAGYPGAGYPGANPPAF